MLVTGSGCREGGRLRGSDELIVPVVKARGKLLGRTFRAVPAYGPPFWASTSGHYGYARDREPEVGKNVRAGWRLGRWLKAVGGLPGDRIRLQRAVDRESRRAGLADHPGAQPALALAPARAGPPAVRGPSAAAVRWSARPGRSGCLRCCRCGRFLDAVPGAYGGGLAWCPGCALLADARRLARRLPPRPQMSPSPGAKAPEFPAEFAMNDATAPDPGAASPLVDRKQIRAYLDVLWPFPEDAPDTAFLVVWEKRTKSSRWHQFNRGLDAVVDAIAALAPATDVYVGVAAQDGRRWPRNGASGAPGDRRHRAAAPLALRRPRRGRAGPRRRHCPPASTTRRRCGRTSAAPHHARRHRRWVAQLLGHQRGLRSLRAGGAGGRRRAVVAPGAHAPRPLATPGVDARPGGRARQGVAPERVAQLEGRAGPPARAGVAVSPDATAGSGSPPRYELDDLSDYCLDPDYLTGVGPRPGVTARPTDNSVFVPADLAAMEARCAFMGQAKAHPERLTEPRSGIAKLAIIGRCAAGDDLAHERSRGHPGYTPRETIAKLEHALRAGPPSCTYIEQKLGFGGCAPCPYRGKMKSPILLGRTQAQNRPLPAEEAPPRATATGRTSSGCSRTRTLTARRRRTMAPRPSPGRGRGTAVGWWAAGPAGPVTTKARRRMRRRRSSSPPIPDFPTEKAPERIQALIAASPGLPTAYVAGAGLAAARWPSGAPPPSGWWRAGRSGPTSGRP